MIGIRYSLEDRIPIFQTWIRIRKLERSKQVESQLLEDAKDALVGLLQFRNQGYEPRSKGGTYVKEV